MLKRPSNGFVAGLIVGSLLITLFTALGFHVGSEKEVSAVVLTSEKAAQSFVGDWTRMRGGTWAVDYAFTRTLDDGRQLSSVVHQAQRPPDSIREASSSADVTVNGRRYTCAADDKGHYVSCRNAGIASTFTTQVKADVALIRNDVLGKSRNYDVQQLADHCYKLVQRPDPKGEVGQWGTQGKVCFDEATGAPIRTEVVRPGAVDVLVATAVRPEPRVGEIKVPGPITS